ncbi:PHP domain-containing protein [Candidatus Desulforudis audaxviator]|uniref:PHP C-terminal domain protein n=1 Tax=Desulforudis audaxviator (strain MP104C) TaxID=477974 RepID=B1I3H8_DESAP|nr:PHP domain-containing protein [Candidatus Desulforudis audaxviator]ACA59576.1 PHP C-terminal domain protein [Candidatus Desulforudis audaxviator MP104C]AZK59562.1 metal-dependent phosphoesterases (PHP family) [Candidatus Desulforudis audaxviator]
MPADLHVHTTASDGTVTPAGVVQLARALGLGAIAITDHDTVSGVAPALQRAGATDGPLVIPGIEISASHQGRDVHILGYYVDTKHAGFLARIKELAEKRAERAARMIARLQSLGLAVTLNDVLDFAGPASLGRPHIADALLRAGIVKNRAEAFSRWIGRDCPGYVSRQQVSPFEAVALVRLAKGVPVLAHPGTARVDDIIADLAVVGLQGLEVYHPDHTPEQVRRYLDLAAALRLVATGGSDFHGSDNHGRLGEALVPLKVVEELKLRRM